MWCHTQRMTATHYFELLQTLCYVYLCLSCTVFSKCLLLIQLNPIHGESIQVNVHKNWHIFSIQNDNIIPDVFSYRNKCDAFIHNSRKCFVISLPWLSAPIKKSCTYTINELGSTKINFFFKLPIYRISYDTVAHVMHINLY